MLGYRDANMGKVGDIILNIMLSADRGGSCPCGKALVNGAKVQVPLKGKKNTEAKRVKLDCSKE